MIRVLFREYPAVVSGTAGAKPRKTFDLRLPLKTITRGVCQYF